MPCGAYIAANAVGSSIALHGRHTASSGVVGHSARAVPSDRPAAASAAIAARTVTPYFTPSSCRRPDPPTRDRTRHGEHPMRQRSHPRWVNSATLNAMPTVVAAWTKVIVDYAAAHGVDVSRPDVDLSQRDLRIPAHLDEAIWQAADRALGDDDLGIHLAESGVSAASFGVVGYLVRASTTVGEALARAHHFHRLVKDRGRLELVAA